MIASCDSNYAIGSNNGLLFVLKKDMDHFRKSTMGGTVIMGSKTWHSLPFKPLKGRKNVVITRDWKNYESSEHVEFIPMEKLSEKISNLENVWVIGGSSIYEQLLPDCEVIYITKCEKKFSVVDRYFPKDKLDELFYIESVRYLENDDEDLGSVRIFKYVKKGVL